MMSLRFWRIECDDYIENAISFISLAHDATWYAARMTSRTPMASKPQRSKICFRSCMVNCGIPGGDCSCTTAAP